MAKVICLFNHKGGVSKTTTTFNIGWMLATLGKKVILADFDPQCNLTGMVLGYKGIESEAIYKESPANNVKDGLAPAFESKPRQIEGADCFEVPGRDGLWLLQGHIGLSEYETILGIAQELSGSLLTLKNLPGSLRYLLDETAEKYNADYVLVDMSPSLGPINKNLLMTADHFIVPLYPDYFSSMALNSLAKSLPRWAEWADAAYSSDVLRQADYPFPKRKVTFIGAVVQNYRPKSGKPAAAFQRWLDELEKGLSNTFIPKLAESSLINVDSFNSLVDFPPSEPILRVADFNSLIAISQEHQTPVYALTQAMAKQAGAVWSQTKNNQKSFKKAFNDCAETIISLAG